MTPMHSPDQPDRPDRPARPASRAERRITIPVSQEMLLKMRSENAVAVREADWERFVRKLRDMDGRSNEYLAAGWAMIGVAVTLWIGVLTIPVHAYLLAFAVACTIVALGCFRMNRDMNGKRENVAEELAAEMEEAADLDNLPIAPDGGSGPG
jgi:Flp pilus assembly protein TadB